MDRGAWQAAVLGVTRVGYDLATKERKSLKSCIFIFLCTGWLHCLSQISLKSFLLITEGCQGNDYNLMCIQSWESPLKEDGLYNNVLVVGATEQKSRHLYQICSYLVARFLSLPIIYICRLRDTLITFGFEELFGRVVKQSNWECFYAHCSCNLFLSYLPLTSIILREGPAKVKKAVSCEILCMQWCFLIIVVFTKK